MRATALSHLPDFPRPSIVPAVESALRDGDALVRLGGASGGGRLARRPPGPPGGPPPSRPGESRAPRGGPDPRGVPLRRGAARRLRSRARRVGPVGAGQRGPARGAPQSREPLRAPRPAGRGRVRAPHRALARPRLRPGAGQSRRSPARRGAGRGRRAVPRAGAPRGRPSTGRRSTRSALLRVRQKRLPEAVDLFRRAARARPESPRFAYVYAVALHDTGRAGEAITVLEGAPGQRPGNREILAGAGHVRRRARRREAGALEYAERLVALDPTDPAAQKLVETLRRQAGARSPAAPPCAGRRLMERLPPATSSATTPPRWRWSTRRGGSWDRRSSVG